MRTPARTFWMPLMLLCLTLATATAPHDTHGAAAVSPATECGINGCQVYLPFIARSEEPELVAPANGAQTNSLAPVLSWTPSISATYLLQVSTDPSFTTTVVSMTTSLSSPLPSPAMSVIGNNLHPTTLFYWRVGLVKEGGHLFSPTWSFTTSASNTALLPPPPQLLAPPDHTTLISPEVTLSWQSVPDALYYRIRVLKPDGSVLRSAIRAAPATTYHISGLAPATTYTWKVKTLNQYGWGDYQTSSSFKSP